MQSNKEKQGLRKFSYHVIFSWWKHGINGQGFLGSKSAIAAASAIFVLDILLHKGPNQTTIST